MNCGIIAASWVNWPEKTAHEDSLAHMKHPALALSMVASLLGSGHATASMVGPGPAWLNKLDGELQQHWIASAEASIAKQEPVDVLIVLHDRSSETKRQPELADSVSRREFLARRLRSDAARSQQPLREWLSANGIESRSFWVVDALTASVPESLIPRIAARPEVAHVISNAPYRQAQPPRSGQKQAAAPIGIPWGVQKIRAPEAWTLGYRGQGAVVGGQDTGYQWEHPALQEKYRGWNGAGADHDYNWHDAIHQLIKNDGPNSCGLDLAAPCDDSQHGTHTMGTMVGDDGVGNQPGVAPDAQWIGCRNMEEGWGTHSTYIECFQWFIEPTDVAGNDPDPSKAPDVINNSWGCPPTSGGEDCDAAEIELMRTVVNNVRAAGIVVVVSAGNDGPACSTISSPAAIYASSHTVGATDRNDAIADFSSRGPNPDGLLKPNVSAPGVDVCSSIPGGSYDCDWKGTSMAGPHVAGTVALMISANPALRGDPDTIESILESTAVPLTSTQNCGAFSGAAVPNAVFGHGRIDALAAVCAARAMTVLFGGGFEDDPSCESLFP